MDKERCGWCRNDSQYIAYHDTEWGVPIVDDRLLFEFLILEGMQAGLSWLTILKKREAFREAFLNFNANKIAKFNQHNINLLLNNTGIIRNKLKTNAAIKNAKAFLEVQHEWKCFSNYIWHFVNGHPIQNNWGKLNEVPTKTTISDAMSKDLKSRGFTFVGSTICYAFMQAVGLVNDHTVHCFRHREINQLGKAKEILAQTNLIRLTRNESERFIAALQNPPKANEKLKQLFKKHTVKQHRHNEKE